MTELKTFFVDAQLEYEGKTCRVDKAKADALVTRGDYWHGPGDPSTWLCVALFWWVRRTYPDLPQPSVLELGARSMAISVQKLRDAIAWHERYVRWHDGDDTYRVLDPEGD